MKVSPIYLLLFLFLFGTIKNAFSQFYGPLGMGSDGIPDIAGGMALRQNIPTKKMIDYEFVREADVLWSKRVWSSIDLRQKINHPLYFPFDDYDSQGNLVTNNMRLSLWNIIRWNVIHGDLTLFSAYNPYQYTITDGDQLKYPVTGDFPESTFITDSVLRDRMFYYLGNLGPQSLTPLVDIYGNDSVRDLGNGFWEPVYPPRDTNWVKSQDIIQYHLKEDWFFDKERSVMDVRIIAMAPVIYDRDPNGQIIGTKELFWLYFPQCRLVFNNYYTFNDKNDAQWMSVDDLFWKRRFSSEIYKESNVYDRGIDSYSAGSNALYESGKIKEGIRSLEHDIWNF